MTMRQKRWTWKCRRCEFLWASEYFYLSPNKTLSAIITLSIRYEEIYFRVAFFSAVTALPGFPSRDSIQVLWTRPCRSINFRSRIQHGGLQPSNGGDRSRKPFGLDVLSGCVQWWSVIRNDLLLFDYNMEVSSQKGCSQNGRGSTNHAACWEE